MINDLKTIVIKEWKCFTGSDRGAFLLYAVLIVSWSFFLAGGESLSNSGPFWLVFFSVVVAANFSNTVFISERVTGALEVLITSGFSRNSILFGKMIFVMVMSLLIGAVCIALAELWNFTIYLNSSSSFNVWDILTYATSAFVNVAGSAWLSVRMANPRLLHLANLFLLGGIITGYTILTQFYQLPDFVLSLVLAAIGAGISVLAKREFESERVIQPVIF